MKKKISVIFAFILITICCAFVFNAYADETTTIPENVTNESISITNKNTVLKLSTTTYTYSAKEFKPAVTVVYTDENGKNVTLVKNKDYNVTYSNNKNAGTATVKVECKDKYSGTLSKNFTIKPLSLSSKNFSAALGYTSTTYTGKELKPSVKVVWDNNGTTITLKNNTDYSVKYSANKNIGRATVTINGKNNFNGSVKKVFNILPKQITGVKVKSRTSNSVTITWNKQTNITGYQVVKYDKNKKKYFEVKKLTPDKNSYTITGLSNATAYSFRVRAYYKLSDGKTNIFGTYSANLITSTTPAKVTLTSVTKSGTTINVQWKSLRASAYQIAYSTDKSFKKGVKTVTVSGMSKSSCSIKNVNKNSTYYVRVRGTYTYNKVTYYGAYSSTISTYYSNLYSTYTSKYDVTNVNRTTNLKIASQAISGTIIQPGQTFSFNKVVGPRTKAKGYKEASVLNSSGKGLGGGICQVASTMFNCALTANVSIVERHQHSQRVTYVPLGRDAAIYGTAQDFKWKNNTKYPIRVVMTVKDGKITCSFYTNVKAAPSKVSLKVTQNGKNFTLKRTVNNKVNYTAKSKY